jgi:hypothetical protein
MNIQNNPFADLAMISKYKKIYFEFIDEVPVNEMTYAAYMGFKNTNTNCIPIRKEDLGNIVFEGGEMAIGGLEFTMTALINACSLTDPSKVLQIPDYLMSYKKERMLKTSLSGLMDNETLRYPIRTLPLERLNDTDLIMLTSKEEASRYVKDTMDRVGKDLDILVEEVWDGAVEYSAYICNNQLLDIRGKNNLQGFIQDVEAVKGMIEKYKIDAPSSYILNFNSYPDGTLSLDSIQGGYSFPTNGLGVFNIMKMLVYGWEWFIQKEKEALSNELQKNLIS